MSALNLSAPQAAAPKRAPHRAGRMQVKQTRGGIVIPLLTQIAVWRHRRAQRRALAALDPRLLADIGQTPDSIRHETGKPFWSL